MAHTGDIPDKAIDSYTGPAPAFGKPTENRSFDAIISIGVRIATPLKFWAKKHLHAAGSSASDDFLFAFSPQATFPMLMPRFQHRCAG
jgi:hypothetical protein